MPNSNIPYIHCLSRKYPSHIPTHNEADDEGFAQWRASLSDVQRTEYEKTCQKACRITMVKGLPADRSPLPTTRRFYTPKVSDEHPWSWQTGPYKDLDEYYKQVNTFRNIYTINSPTEQDRFYWNLHMAEQEFLNE